MIGQQQVPKFHSDLLSYLQATKTYSEPAVVSLPDYSAPDYLPCGLASNSSIATVSLNVVAIQTKLTQAVTSDRDGQRAILGTESGYVEHA